MAKVIQKQGDCIGCGACSVVCPEFWEMDEDSNKAKPKLGQLNQDGDWEFEVDEKGEVCNKEAVESCPVQIIKIKD